MSTIKNLPEISKISQNELEARQANWLIESSSSMTVNEKRVLYYIISKANPMDFSKRKDFEINVRELSERFGLHDNGGKQYTVVRNAIERLWGRDIITRDRTDKITKFRLLQRQEYQDRQGFIKVRITDDLQSAIYSLHANYTTIAINNLTKLTSSYSFKLYELLWQYREYGENKLSYKKTRKFTLETLRFYFDCETTYPKWDAFKCRTILPAIKELTEKTNILVEFEVIKKGKSVVGVNFIFGEKGFFKDGKLEYKRPSPPERPKLKRATPFVVPEKIRPELKTKIEQYWKNKMYESIWLPDLSDAEEVCLRNAIKKFKLGQLKASIINLRLLQKWHLKLTEWGGHLPENDKLKLSNYKQNIAEISHRYPNEAEKVIGETNLELDSGMYGRINKIKLEQLATELGPDESELTPKDDSKEAWKNWEDKIISVETINTGKKPRGRPRKRKPVEFEVLKNSDFDDDIPF